MTSHSPNPEVIGIDVLHISSVGNEMETLCRSEIAIQNLKVSLYHHSQCSVLRLLRAKQGQRRQSNYHSEHIG